MSESTCHRSTQWRLDRSGSNQFARVPAFRHVIGLRVTGAFGKGVQMPAYYLVNTNETHRPKSRSFMLANKCIIAQYEAKMQIDVIERNDLVFIYQNGEGVIAVGTADGQVLVQDYEQKRGERHLMKLLRLQELGEPIPPSIITEMVHEETGKGVYYARTVVPLPPETGKVLYQMATGTG